MPFDLDAPRAPKPVDRTSMPRVIADQQRRQRAQERRIDPAASTGDSAGTIEVGSYPLSFTLGDPTSGASDSATVTLSRSGFWLLSVDIDLSITTDAGTGEAISAQATVAVSGDGSTVNDQRLMAGGGHIPLHAVSLYEGNSPTVSLSADAAAFGGAAVTSGTASTSQSYLTATYLGDS